MSEQAKTLFDSIFTVYPHHFIYVIVSLNLQLCLWLQLEWKVWYKNKSKFCNALKVLYMYKYPSKDQTSSTHDHLLLINN